MGEVRQRYNEEFKKQTVKYIQEQTKTTQQIAEELNIPVGTLYDWVAKYRDFKNEIEVDSREKIRELERRLQEMERENQEKERENLDLREELSILKKAMHIFSKPRN
ncbi:transposase [Paenibacillus sp. GYB003]